jgi:RecA/RadA recombinase
VSARSFAQALGPEIAARLVSLERLAAGAGTRATGIGALDELLRGGWPRGALSEIAGPRSSGRTAVVLRARATACAAGEATALVDVGGALDPRAAAACGVPLPALLWIRCATARDQRVDPTTLALKAADLVVAAGGFGVVAIDLGDARARIPDASWLRLQHAARNQATTVLVTAATRAARAFAAAAIELGPRAPRFLTDGPPLFDGLDARAVRARALRDHAAANHNGVAPCASLAFTSRS